MNITTVPKAVLRLQYQLVRFPLGMIDQQIRARIDEDAPVRLIFERSLGALDATVGQLLGDPALTDRGTTMKVRSETLAQAVDLEARAEATEQAAETAVEEQVEDARATQQKARQDRERAVAGAKADAAERKRTAAANADAAKSAAQRRADEAARKRVDAAEAKKRAQQDAISSAENAVVAEAEEQQDHAREKAGAAASLRARADRVEELADAEKRSRKQS
ncbi:hypothetical protein BCA37_20250 [Mycobacterium sp. djl-10]|nr:hypothetical protein BCA37_20250 [Mycobacterium sp. djl-10]